MKTLNAENEREHAAAPVVLIHKILIKSAYSH